MATSPSSFAEAPGGRSCSFPTRTINVWSGSCPQPAHGDLRGNANPGGGRAESCPSPASAEMKTQTRSAWHIPGTAAQIIKGFNFNPPLPPIFGYPLDKSL